MVTARQRRRQVAYGIERGLSQRRACRLFSVARSTLGYCSILKKKDAPALVAMRRLAPLYLRFGYRRIAILLRREGYPMSFDRAFRLWKQAELQVPKKSKLRRPAPLDHGHCRLSARTPPGPTGEPDGPAPQNQVSSSGLSSTRTLAYAPRRRAAALRVSDVPLHRTPREGRSFQDRLHR